MTKASAAIITCYHFDNASGNQEAYRRLLGSLCASLLQLQALGGNSRLILIANGTNESAMRPEKIIEAIKLILPSFSETLVHTCALKNNRGNTGSLNRVIEAALEEIGEVDWIGSVQSSATIEAGWLPAVIESGSIDPCVGGSFGRIGLEEEKNTIWTDGHFLKKGLTFNANYERRFDEARLSQPGQFPCLSASLFRRSLVDQIWKKYGNFVCEHLSHYGDCTDVALRAHTVEPSVVFKYSETATAYKRRPTDDWCKIAVSQLLAASRYYPLTCRAKREESLRTANKYSSCFPAACETEEKLRTLNQYSPNGAEPPHGMLVDLVW